MVNLVIFAMNLLAFSLNFAQCMERKVRKERYKHGDCKTSQYDHLNTCISVHWTKGMSQNWRPGLVNVYYPCSFILRFHKAELVGKPFFSENNLYYNLLEIVITWIPATMYIGTQLISVLFCILILLLENKKVLRFCNTIKYFYINYVRLENWRTHIYALDNRMVILNS